MSGREMEGSVVEALPGALYRVQGDDGRTVVASLGGIARQVTVKIIPGDRVLLEVSPLDPSRARIKGRIKAGRK
jgi:translation initiation factor IF-1